jgi:TRAP-type C4-dicarboxylate transport system permease small subunit
MRLNTALERALGGLLSVLMLTMVLTVLWQVATRLSSRIATAQGWTPPFAPSQWTEELASFQLAWIALLGAAYALRRGEHMGYDSLFVAFGAAGRRRNLRFIKLCVIAFASVLVIGGVGLVAMTLELGQTTPALRWPMGWVYSVAPLSGLLMICFAAERVFLDDVALDDAALQDAALDDAVLDRSAPADESGNHAAIAIGNAVESASETTNDKERTP